MKFKKTKIVATIGPASNNPETLTAMVENGLDVARLNFSHGTHEEKKAQIKMIRGISEKLKKPVGIIADLQGPKLRIGDIDGVRNVLKDEKLVLSVKPRESEIPLQFDLSKFVKKGERIFINDGLVVLIVTRVSGDKIYATSQNNGVISSKKGINVPDTILGSAAFTEKDELDAKFALSQNVDFVAMSFVQKADDLNRLSALIKKYAPGTKTIAKIEKPEAVKNLEEIIAKADSVMVARGDLATETSAAEVPIIQQRIVRLARQLQKPVIVATQMLESMIENPRPTRAEASDVANAVLSQVDAVMLSAESASGKYPIESVRTMREIIERVELDKEFQRYVKINWETVNISDLHFNALVSSAAALAYRLKAPFICMGTVSGRIARQASSFRPDATLLAFTHSLQVYNQLALTWGTYPIVIPATREGKSFSRKMIETLQSQKLVAKGSRAILVWGTEIGVTGTTDTIRVVTL